MTWLALLTNRWVQLAAGTALGLVLGFGLGHHQKTLEDAAAQVRGLQQVLTTTSKQAQVTVDINKSSAESQEKTRLTTTSNLQRIPIYVTRKADDQCIVGRGAVQLLDAAAGDTVPGAPGGVQAADPGLANPDAESGVKLSSIVQADIVNAGNYHTLAERLRAWDAWFDAQSRVASGR